MKNKGNEWIDKGDKAFLENSFEQAMEFYVQSATALFFDPDLSAENAMQKTVVCYQKINPSFYPNPKKDYIQQYFNTVRHWQDHIEINDLDLIQKEITRRIPIEPCENREIKCDEGSTSQHSTQIGPYPVSISTAQGIRDHMEDAYFITEVKLNNHHVYLFCVLDGHGGANCSKYLSEYFPTIIKDQLSNLNEINDLKIYHALKRSCVLADEEWKNLSFQKGPHFDRSGSTATLACMIDHDTLWVANVGDSGATIEENGKAIQLTESAKPTIPKYKQEILIRGGFINYARVDSTLDMARSIGDINHPSISARPSIKKVTIDKEVKHLIIACDGLWDVIDAQMALNFIKEMDSEEASEYLRKLAYLRGSTDNVTIIVVGLNQ